MNQSMLNLKDRVAIITGSGRGIGAAIALRLSKSGAKVVINDINRENAEKFSKTIKENGGQAFVSDHDISIETSANALVEKTVKEWGKVDILVNNAGILRDAMLLKMTESQWDDVLKVNLKGPFMMGKACAAVFKEKKSGKILNIASVAWMGNVGQSNYAAAKAGVVGLTRTWAVELARYNVQVNAIAPGIIRTDMTSGLPPEIQEKLTKSVPLGRIGETADIAETAVFLCSDMASYITGQCLHVDGGLTTGLRLL